MKQIIFLYFFPIPKHLRSLKYILEIFSTHTKKETFSNHFEGFKKVTQTVKQFEIALTIIK